MSYVHLHTHSDYSLLDGMAKVEDLLKHAKEMGQNAIAISDHGSTSGLWEGQCIADSLDMKFIHACEFYYERENDGKNGHLLVLAMNNDGLRNLFKMQEIAYVENFDRKPRINWDILKEHNEGLIVTSACLGSTFNQYLMEGDVPRAKAWARKFHEVFGDRFYIEIQPNQIPEQHICNTQSIRIAKELGIEIVATNDVHYDLESDCFPHEVLLAMQTKKKMQDEKRFRFSTTDFWLKSEEEMLETFKGLDVEDVLRAMSNTSVIAERCNARIEKGRYLPKFYNIPKGETERSILAKEIMKGATEKGYDKDKDYMQHVQHELNVIDEEGYSGYFLIVQDYVKSARLRNEPVGDGRGSGAGSKIAYLTDISALPPHEFDLLFERFMAHGRTPDFDVDFADQDAVFHDLQTKYGERNVARIIAFGKMTPKNVTRKVLNTFGHPMHMQNRISKLIGDDCKSVEIAIKENAELAQFAKQHKVEFDVIRRLEGVISHESTHAGGVVIYPDLSSILPIKTNADDRSKRIVGFDKYMLEELGHYKFDILGLETLPVIQRCEESIEHATGKRINLDKIDFDDPNVYDMLCTGDVSGVFQIAGQAGKVMEQKPRNFRDLIAINALIRPGVGDWQEYIARRQGKQWSVYEPRKPYMDETEGTMTYQEQFLLDAYHLAGWDIAYADQHIRKNKDIRNDEALREKFVQDGIQREFDKDEILNVWSEIEDAVDGGYSFNKSHSASYARISFKTAWLKHYYPTHFYASLMSGEKTDGDGQDAIAGYIAECKERGIEVRPPDINHSDNTFVVVDDAINYRITTVKHVGDSAIDHIRELRPIVSFDDFMERRNKSHAKKNVVINLIKAGAFDFDNPNRAELMWKFDMSERTKTQIKNDYQCENYEWNDSVKAEWEKDVLGMYLSTHPMERYGFKKLSEYPDRGTALQGGEIYDMKEFKDRNGNKMAFIFINTLFGNVKILVFASTWSSDKIKETLAVGNRVLVRGKRSGNDLLFDSAEVLD